MSSRKYLFLIPKGKTIYLKSIETSCILTIESSVYSSLKICKFVNLFPLPTVYSNNPLIPILFCPIINLKLYLNLIL